MSSFRLLFGSSLLAATAVFASTVGCDGREPAPSKPVAPAPRAAESARSAENVAAAPTLNAAETDAAPESTAEVEEEPAEPPYDGPYLYATYFQTPIMSEMEWPKEDKKTGEKTGSMRIGYIRQGARVPVIAEAHKKSNCKDGWYELVQGGFVCGRYATLDGNHPRIKVAPHPPNDDSSLPYEYGYNVANGTPLYRQIPSREERLALEPWLAPKKPKRRDETITVERVDRADPYDGDAGAPLLVRAAATEPATTDLDAGTPWYLRDYDGGKPQVTLDELRGEGPVSRRMVKGFFLALDKSFTASGARWWKNTSGSFVPFERVYVYDKASEFHGLWLDRDAKPEGAPELEGLARPGGKAQIGIVTVYKAKKYIVSANRKAVTTGDPVSRHTVHRLTGEAVSVNGARYEETSDGWWMKSSDGTKTEPGDPPKGLQPGEKWIDVNVRRNTLVAYEGDKPVFATAVSVGKENKTDKEKNHRTPPGTFRIREKHIASTMDGDVASDGPYSIEDVPWVMYYSGSYALHGAFWHNNFGNQRSHGCVNLAPPDAKALFAWAEPKVPEGWHAVWSTAERPGTRVVVHE